MPREGSLSWVFVVDFKPLGRFAGPQVGVGYAEARTPAPTSPQLALTKPPSIPLESALSYADKTLTCRDCGRGFAFTRGEQEFYASRGFTNEPGRCPDCRQSRRAPPATGTPPMAMSLGAPVRFHGRHAAERGAAPEGGEDGPAQDGPGAVGFSTPTP